MKGKKKILILTALLLTAILAVPYLKAELLTAQYGAYFADEYKQCGMIDEIAYFKVISYSDRSASVFYVLEGHSAGVRMRFENADGEWLLAEWSTIWSASGSADGFCWPYYR